MNVWETFTFEARKKMTKLVKNDRWHFNVWCCQTYKLTYLQTHQSPVSHHVHLVQVQVQELSGEI